MEIGCGTGFALSGIRQEHPLCSLTGSELFLEGLQHARLRLPQATFYQMDICRMPFENEFDVILTLDILEHIIDDCGALDEVYRSLKPGGGIIVTVPQHPWLWSIQDKKAFHVRRYPRKELIEKMRMTGFEIIHVTSFITFLLPVMVVSRLHSHYRMSLQNEVDPLKELKIPKVISRIFGMICKAEDIILRSGISLPMGGSLLCIGRKGY